MFSKYMSQKCLKRQKGDLNGRRLWKLNMTLWLNIRLGIAHLFHKGRNTLVSNECTRSRTKKMAHLISTRNMVDLTSTRHDWLQKHSLNERELTMRRHLIPWKILASSNYLYPQQHNLVGRSIRWMWRIPSSMEVWRKRYTCTNHMGLGFQGRRILFADWRRIYMVQHSHPRHGTLILTCTWMNRGSNEVLHIPICTS